MSIHFKDRAWDARYERVHLRLCRRIELADAYDAEDEDPPITIEHRRLLARLDRVNGLPGRVEAAGGVA